MAWLITPLFFSTIALLANLATSNDIDIDVNAFCTGNSTTGNPLRQSYQRNVASLVSELGSNSHPPYPGYFNTTAGQVPDKAYGYYFCQGDVEPEVCHNCVSKVTKTLWAQEFNHECFAFGSNRKSLDDDCMVHYADQSMFSVYREGYVLSFRKIGGNVSKEYNQTLTTTFHGLIQEAALGNWSRTNFEKRVVKVMGSKDELYILVQCTPDISATNCSKCLAELYSYVANYSTEGGMIRHANCLMKYDNKSFFGGANSVFTPGYLHVYFILLLLMSFLGV